MDSGPGRALCAQSSCPECPCRMLSSRASILSCSDHGPCVPGPKLSPCCSSSASRAHIQDTAGRRHREAPTAVLSGLLRRFPGPGASPGSPGALRAGGRDTCCSITLKTATAPPVGVTSAAPSSSERVQTRPPDPHLSAVPGAHTGGQVAGRGFQPAVTCPRPQRALALVGCTVWGVGFGGWRENA